MKSHKFLPGPIRVLYCIMLIISPFTSTPDLFGAGPEVIHLRTEHRSDPIGIDADPPRLGWQILSGERGVLQTAWQVQSGASENDLESGTLTWDSGKILSGKSNLVEYGGPELKSGQRVYWRVRIWDNHGNVSKWSRPAFFEEGLPDRSDWKAVWIEADIPVTDEGYRPCPYLRKEFTLKKEILSARLYVTCHGLYEIHLNGEKVSRDLFTPGWTSYHKRLQYQAYDVSGMLKKGPNALGAILGEGWYCGPFGWEGKRQLYGKKPALLLQLKISYADGTEEWVLSDRTWSTAGGPILKSEIYDGEIYDARLEHEGWDRPGFDKRDWKTCEEKNYGYDNLVSCEGVPVHITDTLMPVREFITPAGERVFDMGQNMVGWVRLRLQGEKGSEIVLQHAEVLDKEGNFYTDNLRSAKQQVHYTFRGSGTETYEPHFSFQGFRYLKITGYPGKIPPGGIEGMVIHSDMEATGNFRCSDSLLNQLQHNIQWGLRGNFLDVPTDCPQRDERMGWTGDAQVFAPTACFNRDASAFFTKWLRDLAADQRADGSVPWVVPMVVEGGGGTGWSDGYGATGWADAAVILPWTVYQYYGDFRILETQYSSMKAWVEYMIKHSAPRYIFDYGFHFGDWLAFAEYYSLKYNAPDYGFAGANTDKDLIATATFYHSTALLQKTAVLLGRDKDAARYAEILPKIKKAFQSEFMTSTGRLASNTQTAYSLALEYGLLPEEFREKDAGRLAADVEKFGHLTTGFLGTPLLCPALSDNGYPDLAYFLLFQDKYPSWLYPVTMGATTIWERWDGIKPDSTFQDPGMNSFNHYAYGAIGDWIYRNVSGIQPDTDHPGYKKFIIRPLITGRLDYVRAWHDSPYGKIISEWRTDEPGLNIFISVPPNSSAMIYIPLHPSERVLESGLPLDQAKGITNIELKEGLVILEIGSGEYRFNVANTK